MIEILSWNDDRAVVGFAYDYPDGSVVSPHAHDRGEVLYGLAGLIAVTTGAGFWIIGPEQGLWIPAYQVHKARMIGDVQMRNLYVRPDWIRGMPEDCAVLAMTSLARSLVTEATRLPRPPDPRSFAPRDLALEQLLLHELPYLDVAPISVPMPRWAPLRRLCEAFLRRPTAQLHIEDWAQGLELSRRSFTRRFRLETGLSLSEWRQTACAMAAMPRLLAGISVTQVANEQGYDTPAAFATMFRRTTGQKPSLLSKART